MVCCVCLSNELALIDMFSEAGLRLEIPHILRKHFCWIEPLQTDPAVNKICKPCWEQIARFHVLYAAVEKTREGRILQKKFSIYGKNSHSARRKKNVSKVDLAHDSRIRNISKNAVSNKQKEIKANSTFLININKLKINRDLEDNNISEMHENNEISSPTCSSENRNDLSEKLTDSVPTQLKTSENDNTEASLFFYKGRLQCENDLIKKYVKLKCDFCAEDSAELGQHFLHIRTAHKIAGFVQCCNKKFYNRYAILVHIKQHINPQIYKCIICENAYRTNSGLLRHLKNRHGIFVPKYNRVKVASKISRNLGTETCSRESNADNSIKASPDHITSTATSVSIATTSTTTATCSFTMANENATTATITTIIAPESTPKDCPDCKTLFPSEDALRMHQNVYHRRLLSHLCHVCGDIFLDKTEFWRHIDEHAAKLGTKVVEIPRCIICNKVSNSIQNLKAHIRFNHSSKLLQCSICFKGFKVKRLLRAHVKRHINGNQTQCPFCLKLLKNEIGLDGHITRMHGDEYKNKKAEKGNEAVQNETKNGNIDDKDEEIEANKLNECNNHTWEGNEHELKRIKLEKEEVDCSIVKEEHTLNC